MRSFSLKSLGRAAVVLTAMQMGCADQSGQEVQGSGGSGGSTGSGGQTSSGGNTGSGGTSTATGGVTSTGGKGAGGAEPTGGSRAGGSGSGGSGSGGIEATGGGTSNAGGSGSGGATVGRDGGVRPDGAAVSTGGVSGGDGGSTGTGGSGPGGSPGAINWGKEENPTKGCTVGAMPEVGSLKANAKLPDPFTKIDGTRMTDKSEWACRREEILREGFKFIYGDKPIPAKGSVTGTVSTTAISITVTEGGKSTKISATVSMNGATQPAPAIITYGGSGASAPSGVAKINFSPTETTGGSGPKSGPFFDIYGSNHAAGYMVSNAWLVSRIIDVLELNPGIIDPYRVGVTGCSRWGKGAFVAGVLDNRIALTIPVESGIGGTVALRLVEQLDTSGEWPYHAISYVRWLSEVALGQFTSGNSASADNTDKLPIDMHMMAALIVPRGLYIVDNPSTNYAGLDKNSAWVTGNVDKVVFEALGYGDNFSYQGASGSHCQWRTQYTESLNAMIDKFLKGNASATTGKVATDFTGPDPKKYYDWTAPTLAGKI